ncbi:MAG TPA: response regulator [Desulfovibrio sp.]|jgi:DNA-binding NtrC family response regulator|uniref:response regulator n=1 Tax=Desulfovibrio TaxID=872 RepID=UPI00041A9639|nr:MULTISPECIES: response regulator [Desulfovibrio]MDY0306907.1 response regulator [Desulfovibrionaceae bacterium]HMM37239.1 response regulator [Desulfovibrio sp.]
MNELIRVLVVDDDARFAGNMAKLLEAYGLFADTVNSGEEAVKTLGRDAYDVVLLDMRLPGLTGTATLERLGEARVGARIIVVTGHASPDDAAEFLRLGAFDYLLKPCKTEKLLEVIRRAHGSRTGATVG